MIFFYEEKHLCMDDLKYLIWFEEGEDIRRNLVTGKVEDPHHEELRLEELMQPAPEKKEYTGRSIEKEVTYVLKTKDLDLFSKEDVDKYGFQIISIEI